MSRLAEITNMEVGTDGNTSFLRAARNGQLDRVLEHLKSNIDINTSNANGLNALHLASKDGHVEIVEELLKRGAVVDAATKKGNTALHIASLAGQEEVVKLLVQHGASVNVQSQNGFTPLYMAAQENHDNVVKYLLANGANQSLSTEDGFTPLAVAMQQGHDKVVTVLLENDTRGKVRLPALHIAAKKDDVKAAKLLLENDHNPDVTSKSGFTPLHIASHYGNQSIANLLVQKGADVNYSAKHNITPLHVAAKWGKTNMVTVLLEKGANIESKTRDGLTPLHCAARSGHEQVVDMLLEKRAPISSKTKNGLAPLHMAAQGDHVDAARILLYHRAPVDEVTVDYLTALHVAAHCGHVRVAKLLLERQADANARALNGFTPLHIACKKNRIKVVELLLKHGASIGATTESGLTPLHVASFMGCMNIVIYLLQHDAHPDVPTVRGETPLHLAARANQTDIIRILLRNGAQVDARAREQQTPLHIASRLGNVDIVMLLLQHGAKVDNTTKDMYTALHIAAKEGQDEVAAVLIENGASLNATTKKGFTPLHLAAKYGHLKVAKLLLQKEAPVDAQGKNGVTPLHVASHYDHQNVALLLLEKGASPYATAKNGHTPLHIAAKKNQMDIANTLLEYGAKPNAESKAGFTPLHLSAQEGHSDMSDLLIEHKADTNHCSKNGLTPLHLCAQEDKVPVAEVLVKNGASVDAATKNGYTPLHIACHYGQINMVRFLLSHGADVKATTSLGYTPLHQAAQQGHTNIVNALLEGQAQPDAITNSGQTPLHIAQKLGYITVIDTLKVVTQPGSPAPSATEEKYRVVAPEAMHETFMSDSEEEGEDTLLGDQTYRYLTADEMKSLGDDSLPIDVTRDERIDSNKMQTSTELPPPHIEDNISPEHVQQNYVEYIKRYTPDNIDIDRHPINIGFLVSFLVDARGGAMRGCRHSGVRVIVPPRCASSPTRITCRYVRPQRTPHPPPLMEGEALASRVLELGPVGAKFLGPVIIEVPHFAALRGKEREIVILRSDNGESWKEHTVDATEEVLNDVLHDSFDADDLSQMEDVASGRITRIVTQDFPQYFAVVSRIRQEVHAIGPEGGMVSSMVVPQVQAVFPQGALTKKIKVGLQAQPIDPELTAKLLGHGVAVSPVVTVEPRRRKFHKAITLSMPAPRAHSQGMINQYSGAAPTLRLLCSITGGTTRAQWEDVTGSTPLSFVNDCVSFTTTVSARFWLMDCRNVGDATKMATELYKEAIHVPFMAKFVVFAKRVDPLEARLRVFCMTDDKEDKTLEHQEHFTEVAKSRDVEVLEGKPQYVEFAGNLVPITKSGEQLQFSFRAFKENRLPFSVRVKDQHAEAVSRCLFMREAKVPKGEPPQQPICILNIVLPDDIVADTVSLNDTDSIKKQMFANEIDYYRPDPRLADMSNLLGEDWVPLATQLGLTSSEINVIKSEYPDSVAKQAQSMLRMWLSQSGNKAQATTLESALRRIGREDIIPQCLNVDYAGHGISRIKQEELGKQRLIQKIGKEPYDNDAKAEGKEFDKYSAEEKLVETSDEEDFNKTVTERRHQIEERLSVDRSVPASSQRVEIVQEITSIKRQSLVENKIAVVEQIAKEVVDTKTTTPQTTAPIATLATGKDAESARRDSILLEEVTQRFETTKTTPVTKIISSEDPNSPKFSKTPPPSPADFISKEQAAAAQEWDVSKKSPSPKETSPIAKDAEQQGISTTTERFVDSNEANQPLTGKSVIDENLAIDSATVRDQSNALIQSESQAEPYHALAASHSTTEEPVSLLSDKKLDDDKNNINEKKKAKKGFFGSIKTFVEKSFESDSDSEKSPRKSKKPKKDKKKKSKDDKSEAGLPPKKPKLPTPPLQPHDLEDIPYVESSPTDTPPHYKPPEIPSHEKIVPVTDLDADTDITTTVTTIKTVEVVPIEIEEKTKSAEQKTSKSKREKSPKRAPKKTKSVEIQEVTKTIEPLVIETEEFSIVIDPTKKESPKKSKETFTLNIDETIGQIEREILEKSPILPDEKIMKPVVGLDDAPIRPPRAKDHVYEDIDEPVRSLPPDHLIENIEISNIAQTTTDLINNEQRFNAWEDSPSKIPVSTEEVIEKHDEEPLKEKIDESSKQKSKEDKGGFFGLFKKSKKEEEPSPSKKVVYSETVLKDMEHSTQFLKDEVQNYHDARPVTLQQVQEKETDKDIIESSEVKSTGIFSIFKTSKKEESPEKKMVSRTKQETCEPKPPLAESVLQDMVESDEFLKLEVDNYHDVKPTVEKIGEEDITQTLRGGFFGVFKKIKSPPTESKHVHVGTAEEPFVIPESVEIADKPVKIRSRESSAEPGGLFGLFKKSKRDSREGEIKPVLSETVLKDMEDSKKFLNDEVERFQDVKILPPIRATAAVTEEGKPPVESPKPTVKSKKGKQIKSRESSEDRSGFFGIFKKSRKDSEEATSPKHATLSESVVKNIEDSDKFLVDEVTNYHDVKPIVEKIDKPVDSVLEDVLLVEKDSKVEEPVQIKSRESSEDRSGFLGLFKKSKKDAKDQNITSPKHVTLSEPVLKDIEDSNQFLVDEVTNYHDVRPVIEKFDKPDSVIEDILIVETETAVTKSPTEKELAKDSKVKVEEPRTKKIKSRESSEERSGFLGLFKKSKKDAKDEAVTSPKHITISEPVLKDIDDSNKFLIDEVTNYHDVRPIVSKIDKSVGSVVENVFVETETTLAKFPVKEESTKDVKVEELKPKEIKSRESSEDRSGFLGIFKKSKKDKKDQNVTSPKHVTLSEPVLKDIDDSNKFLVDEVSNYHDVRPIVEKLQEPEDVLIIETETTISKSPIKELPTKDVKVKDSKPKKIKSRESSEDRSGFLGLFKKSKKDAKGEIVTSPEDVTLPEHVLKDIDDSNKFLADEVTNYHDVRPIVEKVLEPDDSVVEKTLIVETETLVTKSPGKEESIKDAKVKEPKPKKIKSGETSEDKSGFLGIFKKSKKDAKEEATTSPKHVTLSEPVLKDIDDSNKFLVDEVTNYHDVKPIVEQKDGKEEVLEVLTVQTKSIVPEPEKTGFLGLFKKSKKDIKDEEAVSPKHVAFSENVIKDIDDSDKFLSDEVTNYHDVRPNVDNVDLAIEQVVERVESSEAKEVLSKDQKDTDSKQKEIVSREPSEEKTGFLGFLKKPKKEAKEEDISPKTVTLSESTLKNIDDSNAFLHDEVINYHDVKPIVEKVSDQKPAEVRVIQKETIIVQLPVPDEQVKERRAKESKPKKIKSRESSEDRSGFLGLFKKSKKDGKEEDASLSESVQKDIRESNQFLQDEVDNYHDVKPIIDDQVKEVVTVVEEAPIFKSPSKEDDKAKDTKPKNIKSRESSEDRSGFLGLFKKSKKEGKDEQVSSAKRVALPETVLKDIDDSTKFLVDEVHHYHDVKYIPEKVDDVLIVTKTEVKVASPTLSQEKADTIKIEIKEREHKSKPKKIKSRESSEERTGFLSMFKKPKKDVSSPKHVVSDDVLKDMADTDKFLTDEVTYHHDVREIPQDEDTRTVIEEITYVTSQPSADIEISKTQTEKMEFARETELHEEKKEENVKKTRKVKSRESSEDRSGFFGLFKKSKKDSKDDEDESTKQGLSEEIKKDMDDTTKFLVDEVTNYEDEKPKISPVIEEKTVTEIRKSTDESIPTSKSRETSEERTGFFGLFKKSHKESEDDDTPIAEPCLSDEVIQDMNDTRQFLMDEVENYEDKKPEHFVRVEVDTVKASPKKDKKHRPKSRECSEERSGFLGLFKSKVKKGDEEISETVLKEMEESQQFLTDEVHNYHDVKPTLTEKIEDAEPLIIEKITKTVEEPSKSESSGFFGLFKKSKKEDESVVQLSESVVKDMSETNEFLKDEVEKYHDVKPSDESKVVASEIAEQVSPVVISRESSAEPSGFLSRFKKTKEKSVEPQEPVLAEHIVQDMNNTVQFLTGEIDNYHDVRPIVPESVTEPIQEVAEVAETHESSGFFSLFKKSKKDDKVKSPEKMKKAKSEDKSKVKSPEKISKIKEPQVDPIPALSETVMKDMSDTTTFLTDEVQLYHDVRPVPAAEVEEVTPKKDDAPKKEEPKGFLAKFKKTKKDVDLSRQLSQEVVKDMDDTKGFLKTEVDNYEHAEFITEPKLEILQKTGEGQVEKAIEVLDVETKSVKFDTDIPEVLTDTLSETKTAAEDVVKHIEGTTEQVASKLEKKEKQSKDKKSGIFNIFGKKSKSQDASVFEDTGRMKSDDEDSSPKKKHEKRRKSSSPFKFFDKMRKSEEREELEEVAKVVVTETKREIDGVVEETMTCEVTDTTGELELSQEVLESLEKKIEELKNDFSTDVSRQMQDCGDFLFTEKDNYDSSKPEVVTDIDMVSDKSSDVITRKLEAAVTVVDDIINSATKAIVSDTHEVKAETEQTIDDLKQKSDAELKDIRESVKKEVDGIADKSKQKVDAGKTEISSLIGKLGESVEESANKTGELGKNVLEKTKQEIEVIKDDSAEATTKLSKKAKKKADKAKKESSGFFSKIGEIFSGAAKDAKDELDDTKENVISKAEELEKAAGKTVDEISQKEQEISSRLDDKATKTVQSLEKVSEATFEKAKTETEKAKESVEQAAKSAKDKTKAASQEVSKIEEDITKDIDYLKDTTQCKLDNAKKTTENIIDDSSEKLSSLKHGVVEGTTTVAQKSISETKNKIEDLESVKDKAKATADETSQRIAKDLIDLERAIKERLDETKEKSKDITDETTRRLQTEIKQAEGITEDVLDKAIREISEIRDDAKYEIRDLPDSSKSLAQEISEGITQKKQLVNGATKTTIDQIGESTAGFISKSEHKLMESKTSAKTFVDNLADDASQKKSDVVQALDDIKGTAKVKAGDIIDTATTASAEISDDLHKRKQEVLDSAKGAIFTASKDLSSFGQAFESKIDETKKDVSEEFEGTNDFIRHEIEHVSQNVQDIASTTKQQLDEESVQIKQDAVQKVDNVKAATSQITTKIGEERAQVIDDLTDLTRAGKEKLHQTSEKTEQKVSEMEFEVDDKLAEALKAGKSFGVRVDEITTERIEDFGKAKENLEKKATATADTAERKVEEIKTKGSEIVDKTKQGAVAVADTISQDIVMKKEHIVKASKEGIDSVGRDLSSTKDSAAIKIKETKEGLKTTAEEVSQSITVGFAGLGEALSSRLDESKSKATDIKADISDSIGQKVDDVKRANAEQIEIAKTAVKDTKEDIKSGTQTVLDSVSSGIVGFGKDTVAASHTAIEDVKTKGKDVTDSAAKASSDAVDATKAKGHDVKDATSSWLHEGGTVVRDATLRAAENADDLKASITEKTTEIKDVAKDEVDKKKQDMVDWADTNSAKVKDLKHSTETKTEAILKSTANLVTEVSDVKEKELKRAQQKKDEVVAGAQAAVDEAAKRVDDIEPRGGRKIDELKSDVGKVTTETKGFFSKVGAEVEGMAGQVFGEVGSFDEDEKTPYVTTPTQARRAESQRYPAEQRPAVREVFSPQQIDQFSDEENYIVTEPTEIPDRKRKPLFHIESEEDDSVADAVKISGSRDSIKSNVLETLTETKIDHLLNDLVQDLADSTVEAKVDAKDSVAKVESELESIKKESEADVDEIEKKLRDLDKALDSLEQASDPQLEKKLHRVERKFERMASELEQEPTEVSPTEVATRRDTEFQRLVSQLSTEEVSDFQKEYSHLWDETTFSKSDDWDSKTPDSQIDVQELPQGEEAGTSSAPQDPSSTIRAEGEEAATGAQPQTQRPVSDQHQLSDEMRQLLKDLERESKQ